MPHLSQLQRDYKDKHVTIIGLTSEDRRNTLEMVKEMVEDKGDVMDFTVAWDTERKTNAAYMAASGQRGIPTSFLVDQSGNIAWIGHPMNVDIPLAMVVAGTWDYEDGPAMMEAIDEKRTAIYRAASTDPAKALALLSAFRDEYPVASKGMEGLEFSILCQLPDHVAEAKKVGRVLVNEAIAEKNASALNAFAWPLVDPEEKRKDRFLELAMLAASKANEFSGNSDPAILDTLARVYFWQGDMQEALEIQRRAVEAAPEEMKASLQKAAEEYEGSVGNQRRR